MNKAFISYVRENIEMVDRLCQELKSHGIEVWLDRNDIDPGLRWKQEIRRAIQDGAFFIACFSQEYNERDKTYMNEELTIAIEELRQRPTDQSWFIPVKLNKCEIPDHDIGAGETLREIEYVKLYEDWDSSIQRILKVIQPASSEPINASTSEQPINQNAETYYDLGNAYNDGGNYDLAIKNFNESIKLKPDFAAAYTSRGIVYHNKGDYNRAIEDHTKAIELNPNYAEAYFNRGNAYNNGGDNDRGIENFTEAIKLKPDFVAAYTNRGLVYHNKGDYDRAIEDHTKAIELNPNYAKAYFNRGNAYNNRSDFDLAIADFTKAIELKPDFTHAHENLQYCLQQKKQG